MSLRFERQTRTTLALQFQRFSRNECRISRSPFYELISSRIAEDTDLLDLAGSVRRGQRAPNLFLAAVQYLVLTRAGNPLKAVYDGVADGAPAPPDFFETFRAFCLDNAKQIEGIISTRTVQTNEPRRSALFLPALFIVEEQADFREFHFLDVGCSAGLNLLWDKFSYSYSNGVRCGDESSELTIECGVHGDGTPPLREKLPKAASRVGIEIEPVDVSNPDNVTWLRSLIWPDQRDRVLLLDKALGVLKKNPPRIVAGDCAEKIPEIAAGMPDTGPVCLLFSHSVNQAFKNGRVGLTSLFGALSATRTIFEVSLGNFRERVPELVLARYEKGRRTYEERLAICHPHGAWLRWEPRSLKGRPPGA
jgi:hypothetical protein